MAKNSSKNASHKKIAKELIRQAKRALQNAYAPYSKISVGAALYCSNGNIYTGCNIENASYSLTMCAERIALYKAISAGEKDFLLLLLYSPQVDFILPCGSCLQVLSEFAPEIVIATMNQKKEFRFHLLKKLLTKPFNLNV
jgi:cytidine deaminase